MYGHISIWGVLVAAISAMIVGTLWYSPMLFGKEWSKITGVTDKVMAEKRSSVMVWLILISLITAYVMSLFIVYFHSVSGGGWLSAGIQASLLAGIGFGATAVFAHGLFEPRDKKVLYINAGNRVVTIFIMGLIIAGFLS